MKTYSILMMNEAGIKYMNKNYEQPEMCLRKEDYEPVIKWVDRYLDIYKKKIY